MNIKELIKELNKYNLNKNVVIYSNEKTLKNYEFLKTYENEGQVEIHIDEGTDLGWNIYLYLTYKAQATKHRRKKFP